jgi:hypothetical protein
LDDERIVDGITVERLEPAPGGKPRHRLRTAMGEGSRDGQRAVLEAKLISVVEASPFPVVHAGESDAEAVRRLAAGQRVPTEALGGLPRDPARRVTLVGLGGTPVLVVAVGAESAKAERTVVPG